VYTYKEEIHRGNQHLMQICNFIIENDPQLIIILIGDHGAWLTRSTAALSAKQVEVIREFRKEMYFI
jgi:hypothetical protein